MKLTRDKNPVLLDETALRAIAVSCGSLLACHSMLETDPLVHADRILHYLKTGEHSDALPDDSTGGV